MPDISLDEKTTAVTRIARPVAESMGLELWGVEIFESARDIVRVFVDVAPGGSDVPADSGEAAPDEAKSGVDVEDCAEISRHIALALEVEDIFPHAYVLEVSSPGLSRPFFKFEQLPPYIGRFIEVILKEPLKPSGRGKFKGLLQSLEGGMLTLSLAGGREESAATLPWEAVEKARLIHIFEEKIKPGRKKAPRKVAG